ncbi:MAG TPA: acyl-CoA dehydrogenase family protein [Gaiellaceae bacterium]|nr:acyl-CoA dehydrogenase family protein [Gaiellaceae bacterium]
MNFDWSEEQRQFRDTVVRFARAELSDDVTSRDLRGEFSREAWEKCARFGIQGLPVPAAYGGSGADALTTIAALEGLGYGCADSGLVFSLNAQMWACELPIVKFATEEQKRRYLPPMCDGSLIGAHAMSEPDSGSDALSLRTTAEQRDGRFVLNGSKTFVTNGPIADVFLVFATTQPGNALRGLTAFLVPKESEGLTLGEPLHKLGLRTSPMSELFLDGCELSEDQLLGEVGQGSAVFNTAMHWERGCILASVVGAMERQLERSLSHARERKQYGRPIGSFQAVGHKIVDMKLRLETSKLMLYRLGWLLDSGESTPLDSALTKLALSESFVHSSLDALQVHGGYGYIAEYEIERDVRDALGSRLYSGTSEIQRNIVAAYLGL